jgi:phosphoribosylformimino-5-aminoimidazole carboxamide ribotide isomerase
MRSHGRVRVSAENSEHLVCSLFSTPLPNRNTRAMPSSAKAPKSVFRPCIDLHNGQVKQIVGGTLSDSTPDTLRTNFVAECVLFLCTVGYFSWVRYRQSAGQFAEMYKRHNLTGAHVIKLGPGNDQAAREALAAWPGERSESGV